MRKPLSPKQLSSPPPYTPRDWLEYDYRVWSYVSEVELRKKPRYWITDLASVSDSDLIKEIDRMRAEVLRYKKELS